MLPVQLGQLCSDAEGCCLGKSSESNWKCSWWSSNSPLLLSLLPAVTAIHPKQLYPALCFSRNRFPINPAAISFPPRLPKAVSPQQCANIGELSVGGLVTWQLKYLTYILLSTSKVRWSSASSQNFFPKEFSCCSHFCWNRLLLKIKGRAQGPDPRSCARAGPLSRDFGGAGSF